MAIIKKNTRNISKDMEKREPLYIVGGNINWHSRCGKQYEISFPHTAHVLKKICNCWIREGDRDRVISELFG